MSLFNDAWKKISSGGGKSTTSLDLALTAKNNELNAITGKLRSLSPSDFARRDELQKERASLLEQMYSLEVQRHGQEYADQHKMMRERLRF